MLFSINQSIMIVSNSKIVQNVARHSFNFITCRTISASVGRYNIIKIQDGNDFNERVKNSKVPVVVDFFATWCAPCKALTPRLESVITELKGKVVLAKVDIDENAELALDFEVSAVPVLVGMKDGKVEEKLIGLQDHDKLRQFVQKLIDSHGTTQAAESH